MGDMGDTFRAYGEYKAGERSKIEPSRFEYVVDELMKAGHRVGRDPKDDKAIIINGYIRLWPFTGWWSGKGIGSDRGIHKLLKRLKNAPERQ